MSTDPADTINRYIEQARNVRLGRGVVSKTSFIAFSVVITWVVIAWRWSDSAMANGGLLLIGLIATIFAAWFISSTRRFAENNPSLALLEGAELLEWRKLDVAAKGVLPSNKPILVEDRGSEVPIIKDQER